jgi:glycerol-3-phosphate acyltransferase PlsX
LSERLTLSLDAMGGDNSPRIVIEGVNLVLKELPHVDYLLFGDEAQINPLLDEFPKVRDSCEVRHTADVVDNDMKPAVALRSARQSSMRLAINAVKDGEAAGVVSAGNTGALMAIAKFVLKTLPGIKRPAIAGYFPTRNGDTVMLDLGANVDCDADNLVQFAVMGEVFARNVLGIKEPSIGILNVGAEGLKGNEAVKKAAAILEKTDLPIKFHGFIEGNDIPFGTVDVVVTDGFTGNIALKTAEGTIKMVGFYLRQALMSSWISRIGAILASGALRKLKHRYDPNRYNGAMFLGLNGICVKSHGGTDAYGFSHAIKVAEETISDGLNEAIKKDFALLSEHTENELRAAAV